MMRGVHLTLHMSYIVHVHVNNRMITDYSVDYMYDYSCDRYCPVQPYTTCTASKHLRKVHISPSLLYRSFFVFVRHDNVLALPGILPLLAVSNFAAKARNKTNNSSFEVVVGSIEGEKCTVFVRQSTPANRTGTPASLAM